MFYIYLMLINYISIYKTQTYIWKIEKQLCWLYIILKSIKKQCYLSLKLFFVYYGWNLKIKKQNEKLLLKWRDYRENNN